ncbi:MAG: glycosyltransferase family 4 protein [Pyrinomonadaceae bacterium]
MQIVIVDTTIQTPPTGGAQTFLVDLCRSLTGLGWAVSVVTQPGPEQSVSEALRAAGADVRQDLWGAADLPEERAERLAAWVNSERPEVYVVSISPDAGWLALPLLDPRIATVSVAHNDVSAFYDPLCHYAPFIDCAVGVSEATHRKIVERGGVPEGRARQIAYGVRAIGRGEAERRASEAADARAPLRVGYVGRLVQLQKRVLDFVPLAAELRRLGVSFELHLVGDGEERGALEREFAARGLGGAVKFWGWLSPEEVRARLLALDAFVLLSEYEGLPVALLEAMGHALVPVVTRIESGNAELVRDGENGFVVPFGDTRAAAARLKLLAEDRARLGALRLAAWERAGEFSVGAMVERYVDCFAQVAGHVGAREQRRDLPEPYPPMPSCRSRYPRWARKLKSRLRARASGVERGGRV